MKSRFALPLTTALLIGTGCADTLTGAYNGFPVRVEMRAESTRVTICERPGAFESPTRNTACFIAEDNFEGRNPDGFDKSLYIGNFGAATVPVLRSFDGDQVPQDSPLKPYATKEGIEKVLNGLR